MTRDELMAIARTAKGTTRGALVERAKVVDWLRRQARYVSLENRASLLYAAERILKGEHVREDAPPDKS